MLKKWAWWLALLLMAVTSGLRANAGPTGAGGLPVIVPDYPPRTATIRNPVSWETLNQVVANPSYRDGLWIDLKNPALQGVIYTGQYPFEAGESDFDQGAFRLEATLSAGQGGLPLKAYFRDKYNANRWPQGPCGQSTDGPTPTLNYRVHLMQADEGTVRDHGFFDSRVSFRVQADGTVAPSLSIIAGPFVTSVHSGQPDRVVIAFETNAECAGGIRLQGAEGEVVGAVDTTRHEIALTGLAPNTAYRYQAVCTRGDDAVRSGRYTFHTAPRRGGAETVTFAFGSDSREGQGGGERRMMGHNAHVLKTIAVDAYRRGADFILFGGDLVNGYTSSRDDFRLQLQGWKQSMAGFWRHRPIYPAMGNHETLLNAYDDGSRYGVSLDKWPYATHSAEAVFADAFWNPGNGPLPSDRRRPPYTENVYWFQYGSVACIAFNNNYWWTTNDRCAAYGGSPEGYIMPDQLAWIEQTLIDLQADESVAYIFLYAQEPVFPAGGHPQDAMWWLGDNHRRAYFRDQAGRVRAAGPGMIEVRNRFWRAVAGAGKVAAVLTGDEHAYHRILVDRDTPVGVMADDANGNGILECTPAHARSGETPPERCSPHPEVEFATWQITAGNAGAPWYSHQFDKIPWADSVARFSSQSGYTLFEATAQGVSMTAFSTTGQVVDHVDDLMAVKRR